MSRYNYNMAIDEYYSYGYRDGSLDTIDEVILALENYCGEQRYLISENVWEILKGLKEKSNV